MKKIMLYLFFIGAIMGCQEEVVLDLRDAPGRPVIEAIWTTHRGWNQISISYTKEYYDSTSYTVEEDAEVYLINEGTGDRIDFAFIEQTRSYLPMDNEVGKVGEAYQMFVHIGENIYTSRGSILEPPVLDSVTYDWKERRALRPEGYYLKLYGKIPFEEDNYYRVRVVRNDTLLNRRGDYLLFDDTFGTSILDNGFELENVPLRENDEVRLSLYRLNKEAYVYFNELLGLLFNDGGLFSPPPQNPPSNIRLERGDLPAMGYFLTSPVLSASVTIESD